MDSQTELSGKEKEAVCEKSREAAVDGRVRCSVALGIAKTLGVPSGAVGQMADELKIRICKCQLGCF